jgi:pimeloyl-ACP methyl ester carboxylesterase
MSNKIITGQVSANGFTFKYRSCGMDNTGDLVIFLHGFPESSAMWMRLMKAMAAKNYRCFAFDQRGYSPGARPKEVEQYEIKKLASDVIAVADTLADSQKFHLVGHDWGAAIGWIVVSLYADRIASWCSLSTPHSEPYRWGIDNDPTQKESSKYIHNLLKPGNPELMYWKNDLALLRGIWAASPQEVVDDYVSIFKDKEAVIAVTHYYRATMLYPVGIDFAPITIPSLCILGLKDKYVSILTMDRTHSYLRGYYKYLQLPEADHWLIEKNYDVVEQEVLAHITSFPISRQ